MAPKKTTGKKPSPKKKVDQSYKRSMEALQRANLRLMDNSRSVGSMDNAYLGDSIERRYTSYDSILGDMDILNQEYGYCLGLGYERGSYTAFLKRLASSDRIHHNIIAQCILAYINYGIIKMVVDLYADFATAGLRIIHDNKATQNFYQVWAKKIGLQNRVNRIFCDSFLTANVFIYRINAKLKTTEENEMKRGRAEDVKHLSSNSILIQGEKQKIIDPSIVIDSSITALSDLAEEAKKQALKGKVTKWDTKEERQKALAEKNDRVIPWEYISLPPTQMESRKIGLQPDGQWVFALNSADTSMLANFLHYIYNPKLKTTKIQLPNFLQVNKYNGNYKVKEGEEPIYTSELTMDPDKLTVIQDKKFDYWAWSIPFVYSSLRHLRFKDCLRSMETRVCKSVINTITLWKLGDKDLGIMPGPEEYERLADMLQMPGQALNIIWNPYISADVIEPRLNNILDPKKHDSVNRDVLVSLGIPEVLLGGKGSNFSNSFISVAAILQKLHLARAKIEQWLLGELKLIADAMGFRNLPRIQWERSDLRNQDSERNFKLALFDRGILSAEALLIEAGEDFNTEVARQEREKRVADGSGVGVMDRRGPYFRPEELAKLGIFPYGWDKDRNMDDIKRQDMSLEIERQKKIQEISKQNNDKTSVEKAPNGRPPGQKDTTKRETRKAKPKGIETASKSLKIQELQQKGNSLLKEITSTIKKSQKVSASQLDQLIFSTASYIGPKYTKDIIDKQLKTNQDINPSVGIIFDFLQDQWKLANVNGKIAKADKYKLFLYAWASYYIENS